MKKDFMTMRKFFMASAAVFCCAMMGTTFTACGDDDEEETQVVDTTLTAVRTNISLAVSQDLLDLCDVEVSYVGTGNAVTSETVTQTTWSKNVNSTAFPVTTGYAVNFTKKAGVEIDTTRSYKVSVSTGSSVVLVNSVAEKSFSGSNWSSSMTIPGRKMDAYLDSFCGDYPMTFLSKGIANTGAVTDATIDWKLQ